MDIKQAISGLKIAQDDLYRLATDGKDNFEIEAIKTAIYAMHELKEYKQLGTLEEVREALEKQKAKKPGEVTNGLIWWDNDGNPVWLTDHICAVCGKRIIPEYRHCPYCGQAIDWSEVEE